MLSRDSLLARGLEPLAAGLWTLFVLVSVVVAAVWTLNIGEGSLEQWVGNPDLRQALNWMLGYLDFLWITLAAANTYAGLVTNEGLAMARRWGGAVIFAIIVVAWLSTLKTLHPRPGHPISIIHYSTQLGPKIGPVPIGLPLLWLTMIFGARDAVLWGFPRWNLLGVVLGTGVLVAMTDFSLEPLAAKARAFWFWQTGPGLPPSFDPPLLHWLRWGLAACILVSYFRSDRVATGEPPKSWKPRVTLAIFHVVFLATHVARLSRG